MRIPFKELVRSLVAGETPRADRQMAPVVSHGVSVECQGEVSSVTELGDVLLVRMVGAWSVTELDSDGMPVAVESMKGEGSIAMGAEHIEALSPGASVRAQSTTTLTGFRSSVSC